MPSALLPVQMAPFLSDPRAWALVAAAYLLGSVPFGLIVARFVRGVDLRTIGSGNIGATNAIRAMGRGWGYLVFALDFLKGLLPVLAVRWLFPGALEDEEFLQVLVGAAATVGHCFSIYLGFQGGKGVATSCGGIVAIQGWVFVSGGVVWLITRLATGYAGLASILMGLTFPVAVATLYGTERRALLIGATLLALLIVVRHRSNIQRMLAGTEPNARKKPGDPPPAARPHG